MTDAVFQGTYRDLKFVVTRGAAQIIVEIPIERAAAFVALFGTPNPGAEVPIALARLNPDRPAPTPRASNGDAKPEKERRAFGTVPLVEQIGIRCGDPQFWRFLRERRGVDVLDAKGAAIEVRDVCRVETRKHVLPGTEAAQLWCALDRGFLDWKHEVPLGEPVR